MTFAFFTQKQSVYVLPCSSFIHVYPSVRATSDLLLALHLKVGDDLNYRAYITRSTGPATDIPQSSDTIKFEILISRPPPPSFAMVILLYGVADRLAKQN